MKGADIVRENANILKKVSKNSLNIWDWYYIPMYDEYNYLISIGWKQMYVHIYLSDKYRMSISTIRRAIKRLSTECSEIEQV